MKNSGQILFAFSLSTVKSNPVQKHDDKDIYDGPGQGFLGIPVTGRVIIDQWWVEGPFWVKRPSMGKSLPNLGARGVKKASFLPNKIKSSFAPISTFGIVYTHIENNLVGGRIL